VDSKIGPGVSMVRGRGEPPAEVHRYRESGLDDVWLAGGASLEVEAGVPRLRVQDRPGLHDAIGLAIVRRPGRLGGAELRFLRRELGLGQADVARLLGADVQCVARWERGRSKAPGPADRLMRFLFVRRIERDLDLVEFLEELAATDPAARGGLVLRRTDGGWKAAGLTGPCAAGPPRPAAARSAPS
jgi:putative transcriptional regulator